MRFHRCLWLVLIVLSISRHASRSQSWITSFSPAAYSASAPKNTNILVSFSAAIAPQTLTDSSVILWAEQSGKHSAALSYDQGTRTLTINPLADFFQGEKIDVVLTRRILSMGGDSLPGYSFAFTIQSTGGSGSFDGRSELGIGPNAVKLLTHDFNRDGVVDIELLDNNMYNNRIFFLRNPLGGSWSLSESAYLSWPPVSMAAGDLDNDSQSDFAITKGNDALTIVRRNTWGAYDAGPVIPVGISASQVQIADLNADGWQDLIVGRKVANDLVVLLNSGGGSFNNPLVDLGPTSPGSIFPADIDLDGDMDLLVTQPQTGSVKIYLNNGRGGILDSLQIPVGGHPGALAAGDLNGDGLPDFVAADSAAGRIVIVENLGAFQFSSVGSRALGGSGSTGVLLADFDGDGDLDIAAMNHVSKSVSILMNLASMTFSQVAVVALEYPPVDFSAVDWDFDGDLDIFAISDSINYFTILTNRAGIPRISLPVSSVDFGGATVDSMARRKLWVHNVGGTAELHVHVQHSANPQFVVTPDSLSIAPDDSASVTVGFTPALSSNYTDGFLLSHNDPLSDPLQVSLRGYGKAVRRTDPESHRVWQTGQVPVSLMFAEPMDPATVSDATISIFGSRSGRHHTKDLAVGGDLRTATFAIDATLITEETVTVTLTTGIHTARGTAIVAPYSWSFKMLASQGTAVFAHPELIGTIQQPTGVLVGDLQNDGLVDLVVTGPQTMSVWMANSTGWDSVGGPGSVGGGSLGDITGNGGVGIVSGSWTQATYLWWDAVSSGGKILGAIPDFPSGSTTADFDGDGDLDVLFSFLWQHAAELFRNSGVPPFPGQTFALDGGPATLASADFDGDGLLDFVASTYGRDAVAFGRNLGGGAFDIVAWPFVGQEPLPLAVADFNNDGLPDVAVGASYANTLSVLLNQGNFQFHRVTIDVPGTPGSLAAADFNADGKIDLAAAIQNPGKVLVWTNDGNGSFTKILDEQVGTTATGIAVVDYRRDGRASLVITFDSYLALMENKKPQPEVEVLPSSMAFPNVRVGITSAKSISVRNAGGAGTLLISDMRASTPAFSLSASSLELPVGAARQVSVQFSPPGPHAYVDSIRIASNDTVTPVLCLPVIGTGYPVESVTPAQNGSIHPRGDSLRIEFIEDIDAGSIGAGGLVLTSTSQAFDQNAIASLVSTSGKSLVLRGLPSFHPGEHLVFTITPRVRLGSPATPSSPYSWSFWSTSTGGTGAFEERYSWSGLRMTSPTFLDIDQDGDLDLAYSGLYQNEVFILRNDGTGAYTLKQRIWPVVDCASITAADMDGDGDLDIAVSQQAFTDAITVLRNDGSGNFTADEPMFFSFDPGRIIAADYDNDADADILLAAAGCIFVLDNDGSGRFTLRAASPPGALSLQAVADFDNDGCLDVCTSDFYSGKLAVFSYEGLGTYQKRYESIPGRALRPAAVGDLDGDGLCDIVVGGTALDMQDGMMVLRNNGNWGFPLLSTVPITSYPYGIGVGDLDGDGDLDLVSANTIDAKVTVALNDGTGHFTTNQVLSVAAEPTYVDAGDFDNDGDLDLVVDAYAGGVLHFFKNGFVLSAPNGGDPVAKVFSLDQNFPNPFNSSTTIRYGLPGRSTVRLTIFNSIGQHIAQLVNGEEEAGYHEVQFDGSNLASGVYFYRLQGANFVQTRKLLLIR